MAQVKSKVPHSDAGLIFGYCFQAFSKHLGATRLTKLADNVVGYDELAEMPKAATGAKRLEQFAPLEAFRQKFRQ